MSEDALSLSEKLWNGEVAIGSFHPVGHIGNLVEVADDVAFLPSFANVSAFRTSDGLLLVDTGSLPLASLVHQEIRRYAPSTKKNRLHSAIYSHGHIDHVFGVPVFEEESAKNNWDPPNVLAHEALPHRFDRYILTAGYNEIINKRQFGFKDFHWPREYRYPDTTYSHNHQLEVGGKTFALAHEKGETDDHTVTWYEEKKILCCGDLFIWASPNAGNPQKVQRYPREWAQALRRMQKLKPEVLLPGHGLPIVGVGRIHEALTKTAELLEFLVEETLALMNSGARLNEVLHAVAVPSHLSNLPYLQPVYDEPQFIVRNIWRQYGGWWDGNPSNLAPAKEKDLATELAELAGGAKKLADRAVKLIEGKEENTWKLAVSLAELAWLADPSDAGVGKIKQLVFSKRAEQATSTMSKGIYRYAANEGVGE